MGDLFFFVKMMVYTFILCLLMQARIAGVSIEERFQKVTYESELAAQARAVAEGALRFVGAKTSLPSGRELSENLPEFSKSVKSRVKGALKKSNRSIEERLRKYSERDSVNL